MSKIQKIKVASESFHILLLLLVIVVLFFVANPKTSSILKPISERRWQTFYQEAVKSKIHVQSLWEFREFYSRGYLHSITDGQDKKNFSSILEEIQINPNKNLTLQPILYFKSKKIQSIDFLVDAKKLDEIIQIPKEKIKFSNNELIYRGDNHIKIAFLKSLEELKKVNGYLDFEGKDKNLGKDKMWLELTTISLE